MSENLEENLKNAELEKKRAEAKMELERQKSLIKGAIVVWRTSADKKQFTRPAHGFGEGPFEILSEAENPMTNMPDGMKEKMLTLKELKTNKRTNEISAYYLELEKE